MSTIRTRWIHKCHFLFVSMFSHFNVGPMFRTSRLQPSHYWASTPDNPLMFVALHAPPLWSSFPPLLRFTQRHHSFTTHSSLLVSVRTTLDYFPALSWIFLPLPLYLMVPYYFQLWDSAIPASPFPPNPTYFLTLSSLPIYRSTE